MALTSTQPLPVKQVIYTSGTSPKLTFILATPYVAPLFIGAIVITRTTTGHFSSSITPGIDATHGGKLFLYVDATTFADLRSQAVVPFKVVLSYDAVTNDVVQIDVIRDVTAVSQDVVDALAAALQQILPNQAPAALQVEGENHRRPRHPSAE